MAGARRKRRIDDPRQRELDREFGHALFQADGARRVAELLDAGFDIEFAPSSGVTPLLSAASRGHVEIATLLIERGANLHAVNHAGMTALMRAAFEGRTELVALFLERGVPVNQADRIGASALMHAVGRRGDRREIIRMLQAQGADPDQRTTIGSSPRIVADELSNWHDYSDLLPPAG